MREYKISFKRLFNELGGEENDLIKTTYGYIQKQVVNDEVYYIFRNHFGTTSRMEETCIGVPQIEINDNICLRKENEDFTFKLSRREFEIAVI